MSTFAIEDLEVLRNRTFDEMAIGDQASIERTLTAADIQLFAAMSGDINPQHIDAEFAASTRFHGVIAHGMWGAALISAVLGTRLPGPGTVYAGQTLEFHGPVRVGDTLTTTVTVTARDAAQHRVTLDCRCVNQDGNTVISGEAQVLAPTERIERPRGTLPQVRIELSHGNELVRLLQYVRPLGRTQDGSGPPLRRRQPVGRGRRARGRVDRTGADRTARAAACGRRAMRAVDRRFAIEDVPDSRAAAARAVELAVGGTVEALMKGSLHTDELMGAVVAARCAPAGA